MCFQVQPNALKHSQSSSARAKDTSSNDCLSTLMVPTFNDKPSEFIEITRLTSYEIASLKEIDPFTYYSIPTVRKSTMKGKDMNQKLLGVDALSSCFSPAIKHSSRKSHKVSHIITKQRRLSMEMHPDALLEELLNDPEFMSSVYKSSNFISFSSDSEKVDGDFSGNIIDSFPSL